MSDNSVATKSVKRGRPPIGERAMSSTERSRRFLERIRGTGAARQAECANCAKLKTEIAKLKSEIATLMARLEGAEPKEEIKRAAARPEFEFSQEFGKLGKLRGENAKLKSDIGKLKAMLQQEPDTAKLRKKIVDQQVEMAAMRRAMKAIAKERDALGRRVTREYREAQRFLTTTNYHVIIKALHSDRRKHVSEADLQEAERLAVALRPLFIEQN
jgi:hypothetical protein